MRETHGRCKNGKQSYLKGQAHKTAKGTDLHFLGALQIKLKYLVELLEKMYKVFT